MSNIDHMKILELYGNVEVDQYTVVRKKLAEAAGSTSVHNISVFLISTNGERRVGEHGHTEADAIEALYRLVYLLMDSCVNRITNNAA